MKKVTKFNNLQLDNKNKSITLVFIKDVKTLLEAGVKEKHTSDEYFLLLAQYFKKSFFPKVVRADNLH